MSCDADILRWHTQIGYVVTGVEKMRKSQRAAFMLMETDRTEGESQ